MTCFWPSIFSVLISISSLRLGLNLLSSNVFSSPPIQSLTTENLIASRHLRQPNQVLVTRPRRATWSLPLRLSGWQIYRSKSYITLTNIYPNFCTIISFLIIYIYILCRFLVLLKIFVFFHIRFKKQNLRIRSSLQDPLVPFRVARAIELWKLITI